MIILFPICALCPTIYSNLFYQSIGVMWPSILIYNFLFSLVGFYFILIFCGEATNSHKKTISFDRRSLLSQSPMHRLPNCSATLSPDSLAPMARISGSGSGSSSGKSLYPLQTPPTESSNRLAGRNSESFQMTRISSQVVPCTTSVTSIGNQEMESRKRKLSFHQSEYVPPINLEPEFLLQSDTAGRDSFQHHDTNGDANEDAFDDDQFYEGLDLDAMEAQATLLFKQKSELSIKNQEIIPQLPTQNPSLLSSPSFDLGV